MEDIKEILDNTLESVSDIGTICAFATGGTMEQKTKALAYILGRAMTMLPELRSASEDMQHHERMASARNLVDMLAPCCS